MQAPDDFQRSWRERLASGSKMVAKALSTALREDPARISLVAPLAQDPLPTVRIGLLRAWEDVSRHHQAPIAQHARILVEALAAPEADAQSAALATLANVATHARAEVALALPLVAELLHHKRPALREEAARCLGRLGAENPMTAPDAAARLAHALPGLKNPRLANEAREVLAALEALLPHLQVADRAVLGAAIAPMRGHPNLQVRERAGRIARALSA